MWAPLSCLLTLSSCLLTCLTKSTTGAETFLSRSQVCVLKPKAVMVLRAADEVSVRVNIPLTLDPGSMQALGEKKEESLFGLILNLVFQDGYQMLIFLLPYDPGLCFCF